MTIEYELLLLKRLEASEGSPLTLEEHMQWLDWILKFDIEDYEFLSDEKLMLIIRNLSFKIPLDKFLRKVGLPPVR